MIDSSGIGDQEQLAPSQTASVVVGQTTPRTFNYDQAATLNLSVGNHRLAVRDRDAPRHEHPGRASGNTGLQPYFQFAFPSSSATYPTGVGTVGPVYPYASGYIVFAGNCTDSNPLGKDGSNNPFYPTASPPIVATSAGATATSPVPLYTVAAAVKNGGVAVPAATITATPTTASRRRTTRSAPAAAAPAPAPTLGLVSSDLAGLSTTALPLGHWTLKATSGARTGVVNVWVKPDGVYLVDGAGVRDHEALRPRDDCDLMIRRFRMLRARARRTEAGTTVFEMVVVTALLSLVVVAAFGAVASMQKNAVIDDEPLHGRRAKPRRSPTAFTKDFRAAVTTSVGGAPFTLGRRERRRRSTRTSARCTRRWGTSPDRRSSTPT